MSTSGLLDKVAMASVIDTYELSPMQAGMLFHRLSGGDPHVDLQQVVGTLREPLDEASFLRAWQRVVERHPIFRSRFRWEGVAQPVQDVIDRVQIPVEHFDWRDLGEAERQQRFRAFLDYDRDRGLDLQTAPLMRLALVRASENEWWMVWTNHHAVLDGRSRLLVLRELFDFYEAFLRREDIDLPLPRPFRDYIEWRRRLDHRAAKSTGKVFFPAFGAYSVSCATRSRDRAHNRRRLGIS